MNSAGIGNRSKSVANHEASHGADEKIGDYIVLIIFQNRKQILP